MKKLLLLSTLLFLNYTTTEAQSLYSEVYQIFQNKCMTCHSNATQTAGLDLEGTGANQASKELKVYNNIEERQHVYRTKQREISDEKLKVQQLGIYSLNAQKSLMHGVMQ